VNKVKPVVAHYLFILQGKEYLFAKGILFDSAVRNDAIRKSKPFCIAYSWILFVVYFNEYIFQESAFCAVNTGVLIHLLA
jgi:hypothetical protein